MAISGPSISAVCTLMLASLSLEIASEPREELLTECLCWMLILFCGKIYLYVQSKLTQRSKYSEISVIAFGATLLCLTCSVQRVTWSTAPLLAPALLLIERASILLPEHEDAEGKDQSTLVGWRKLSIVLGIYTTATLFALSANDPLHGFRLKACWIFAQIVLYWGISNRISRSNVVKSESIQEALFTGTELASGMVFITAPLLFLWWPQALSFPHVGMVVILKASRWGALLVLAHELKLSVAAWSTIFAVCTYAVWNSPLGVLSGLLFVGALGATYQIRTAFSPSSIGKLFILGFALCPLWAFGLHFQYGSGMAAWHRKISWKSTETTVWTDLHHPIYHLAEDARIRFERTQLRQSKSLPDAVAEYTRRYGRAPPPGFDQWYKFAVENDVQWIDEYDLLTRSLEPFWKLPPHVLRDYIDQTLDGNRFKLFNTLEVKNHGARLRKESFQHKQLVELLQPVVHLLPDFRALLNEADEPRVLIPYDNFQVEGSIQSRGQDIEVQPVYFGEQESQIVWDSITLPCPANSRARSSLIEPKSDYLWPPFVSNLTESQDLCLKPAKDSKKHGFLSSPSIFHYTQRLVPVMATAKFSTFSDIMMPSSYYYQNDVSEYDESTDIPWEQKKDVVYWRGTGTGGHWTHGSWKTGHRQRFVNFTNVPKAEIRLLQETRDGKLTAYKTNMSEVQEKFDVKFTGFIQCDGTDCVDEESYFHKAEQDHNNDANQYKILYNLDGNSFSGRYYRFLKSNSLVFMQAMFKEWHDDRILPWVHFVPIGLSMEELPETARYLIDDAEGKLIAARIANESREWSRRVLRRIDLTVAYYRVFLEYTRLLDDKREALAQSK